MAVALGKVRNVRIKIAMRITANRREVAMGERERERERERVFTEARE